MEDKNLVNKPVDVDAIIKALRCTSAPGEPILDCKKCPFGETENLTPEQSEQLGTDELVSCDIDRVGIAAADRIANDQTHIAALQKEIEQLRSGRRWIPVTERLPEIESFGTSKVLLGIVENETGFPPSNPCFCVYLGNGKWSISGRFATITHWLPLPEVPEVE